MPPALTDFANRLIKSRRDHTAVVSGVSKSYTTREEYVYDHASRLRFTRHKINTGNWVVTSAPVYDEMGRLKDKRLHASNYDGVSAVTTASTFNYLQSLDYTYNIRNWLTGINDPTTCTLQSGDQLADVFRMQLNYETSVNGSTAQYNGNISSMQWNTHLNGTCSQRQLYMFSYDSGNRLTAAAHRNWNGTAWTDPNQYNESGITYDLNGNLKTYTRRGLTAPSTFGDIDILSYTYGDAQRPDRLTKITDTGDANKGFKHNPPATGNHYAYDGVGNMTTDNHKKITIAYNYLNLPAVITYTDGTNRKIEWTYDANGTKLTKVTSTNGVVNATKNYATGIEYAGANLDAIYFSEGRLTPNGESFYYEYTVKDHLGNARISFRANGTAISILQENHYYPFGLDMEGSWQAQTGTKNGYLYNSKELNEDFGLNWYDYGARWYDAAVGRWWSVDPLSDANLNLSAYNYVENNPLNMIDPTGLTGQMVGADDLTNEEWVIASRNGGNNVNDASKAKREDKNKNDKHDLPVVYYANPAKIKTSTLTSILYNASEIWAKNGFNHLKFVQVSVQDAIKFKESYLNQAFIAFINQSSWVYDKEKNLSKSLIPGISRINPNGTIGVYNDESPDEFDIAWLSWVNIARQKDHANPDYADGYILAHEILHQFLGIASYYNFGDSHVKYYHHTEGDVGFNLNWPGESVTIPKGASKKLQKAETILPWHKELLTKTFKTNNK